MWHRGSYWRITWAYKKGTYRKSLENCIDMLVTLCNCSRENVKGRLAKTVLFHVTLSRAFFSLSITSTYGLHIIDTKAALIIVYLVWQWNQWPIVRNSQFYELFLIMQFLWKIYIYIYIWLLGCCKTNLNLHVRQ